MEKMAQPVSVFDWDKKEYKNRMRETDYFCVTEKMERREPERRRDEMESGVWAVCTVGVTNGHGNRRGVWISHHY